jgi:hypothetical protein
MVAVTTRLWLNSVNGRPAFVERAFLRLLTFDSGRFAFCVLLFPILLFEEVICDIESLVSFSGSDRKRFERIA